MAEELKKRKKCKREKTKKKCLMSMRNCKIVQLSIKWVMYASGINTASGEALMELVFFPTAHCVVLKHPLTLQGVAATSIECGKAGSLTG